MAQVYITMFWNTDKQAGEPIKAYAREEDAKAAAERSSKARARFWELYDQMVKPYSCSYCRGETSNDAHPYGSKDGTFYNTPEGALYGDKRAEFYTLEEVKKCQRQNTMEDYYESIELCE